MVGAWNRDVVTTALTLQALDAEGWFAACQYRGSGKEATGKRDTNGVGQNGLPHSTANQFECTSLHGLSQQEACLTPSLPSSVPLMFSN